MTASLPQHRKLFAAAVGCFAASLAMLPAWDALAHPARAVIAVLAAAGAIASIVMTQGVLRWGMFIAGVFFITIYTGISGGSQILERSRETDLLPRCESTTGARERCVSKSEGRDEHRKSEPDGDLEDGFRQIILRYPSDQTRLILGPMFAVFLVGVAGVLLAKSMGHSPDEP